MEMELGRQRAKLLSTSRSGRVWTWLSLTASTRSVAVEQNDLLSEALAVTPNILFRK